MANEDEKQPAYSLRTDQFKVVHISQHNANSPADQYINECLRLTNGDYTLHTLADRTNIPNDIFADCDTILLSFYNGVDETKVGNLVADAVDQGKNVVILYLANSASYQHPKGRFMEQSYNALTREPYKQVDATLGTIHRRHHPIMNNVRALTLGTLKYRSNGKIQAEHQANVDRVADWSDGEVCVAIRHNKPGLVTEITCHFGGAWGAQSDAPQLLNNALRLQRGGGVERGVEADDGEQRLLKVIRQNKFGVLGQIQRQFSAEHTADIEKNSEFTGWDNVYADIASQFEKILQSTFESVSKQIEYGTEKRIKVLEEKNTKLTSEIEDIKTRFQAMNVPDTTIQQTQAPLKEHGKALQKEIAEWKEMQSNTNKLLASAQQ